MTRRGRLVRRARQAHSTPRPAATRSWSERCWTLGRRSAVRRPSRPPAGARRRRDRPLRRPVASTASAMMPSGWPVPSPCSAPTPSPATPTPSPSSPTTPAAPPRTPWSPPASSPPDDRSSSSTRSSGPPSPTARPRPSGPAATSPRRTCSSTEGGDAERLAPHLLAADARADPWVVETLRRAAARSVAARRPGCRRPLPAPRPRRTAERRHRGPRVLAQLGRAEIRAAMPDDAVDHLRAACRRPRRIARNAR